MKIELSYTEENYLKAIFSLSVKKESAVSTNEIAQKLETKASSVTDMIKKLDDKKLVDYKKYQGVSLTDFGRSTAVYIVRNHRLWEVFLVEKLNFSWDEVHDIAEQLEHVKSEELTERLEAFLDHPTHDPHGDPIPDENGNINHESSEPLFNIEKGSTCVLVGVRDSSSLFLQFLDNSNIKLGSEIKVIHKEVFDNSMTVVVDTLTRSLSSQITKNLFVKEVN
jgi:DtxR family Mn-dependent transcriptional regulator